MSLETLDKDDADLQKKDIHRIGEDLSLLSVEELHQRVLILKQEIERLQDACLKKENAKKQAEDIFKR